MKRVLIIEDQVILSDLVCRIINDHAFLELAGRSNNGLEALELVKRENPDIVILDIGLPGMNGIENALGREINRAVVGQIAPQEALDNAAAAVREIMDDNGFYGSNPPVDYASVAPGLYVGEGKDLPF